MTASRNIVETRIIIEYLQLVHPGPVRLLPADPMAALAVRFLSLLWPMNATWGSRGQRRATALGPKAPLRGRWVAVGSD